MTNEFALRAARMSLRTFISSHRQLGDPEKLTRMYQKALNIANKAKLQAKENANAKTRETGRVLVNESIKAGDSVRVLEDGAFVMKTVKSVGKVFRCRTGNGKRRYAYFN